jgi:RND family efflux transporter MFP subunit
MDPFSGQRWNEVRPEQIGWHLFTVGVLGLMLLVLLVSVQSLGEPPSIETGPPMRTAIPVEVEPVQERSRHSTLRLPGVVEPGSRAELGFRVDGHIAGFRVREGERVEVGEIIADLDADELEREVRLASAQLESARAVARGAETRQRRQSELLARNSTSIQHFDQAELDRDVAASRAREAELHLSVAQRQLEKARLRAPFAGIIEARLVEPHELTTRHSTVVVLTDLSIVKVQAALPDRLIARLEPGAEAIVHAAAWPGREFSGRVSRIDVSVDPTTRTVPFEITVNNTDLALRPQLGVELELSLSRTEARTSLPLAAVLRDSEREPFCFVVDETDGGIQAERRPLVLGEIAQDRVVITAGLTPGESVVVRGQHFVHAGDPLNVVAILEDWR